MRQHAFFALSIFIILMLKACATPYVQKSSLQPTTPVLEENFAIMGDGYRLPLTVWKASSKSRALLLALHGLNDYSNGLRSTGEHLARHDITTIAYDQRGFGKSDGHGLWHGSERMTEDLHTIINLLHNKHPNQPLYLLGESMGGAMLLAAMNQKPLPVDGIVVVAPAVWSRDGMPLYQRFALWVAAHTTPSLKLTGEGLDLRPSDNIEMLRAWGRDPLIIKSTRVDVLYGVSNLMDQAVASADDLISRMLILYGKNDDIIPHEPTCQWLHSLPPESSHLRQTIIYEDGYHMLTRDLQAAVVLQDITNWIIGAGNQIPNQEHTIRVESFCPGVSDSSLD